MFCCFGISFTVTVVYCLSERLINSLIKERLRQRYNLAKEFAVYGIFSGILIKGIDHDNYSKLVDYVIPSTIIPAKNGIDVDLSRLENYNPTIVAFAKMLNDPQCDFDKLCELIDSKIVILNDKNKSINPVVGGQK